MFRRLSVFRDDHVDVQFMTLTCKLSHRKVLVKIEWLLYISGIILGTVFIICTMVFKDWLWDLCC